MKTTLIKVLGSSATCFALVSTAFACPSGGGGGGGYRSNSSYNSYPSQYSSSTNRTSTSQIASTSVKPRPVVTVAATTPVAPTARITTVTESAPAGRLQIASPVVAETVAKTEAVEVAKPTASTNEVLASTKAAIEEKLASLDKVEETPEEISEGLKGLVGTWMAVSRQGDGELSTVELQLNDNGWAKLTVPGSDGKSSTTTRKAELDNNELKLTGGDAEISLGKLVDFNSRQMILERSGSQVTFVRP